MSLKSCYTSSHFEVTQAQTEGPLKVRPSNKGRASSLQRVGPYDTEETLEGRLTLCCPCRSWRWGPLPCGCTQTLLRSSSPVRLCARDKHRKGSGSKISTRKHLKAYANKESTLRRLLMTMYNSGDLLEGWYFTCGQWKRNNSWDNSPTQQSAIYFFPYNSGIA